MSSASKPLANTSMLAVTDGQTCVGFVLGRGKLGFEAFDVDHKSLGLFASQHEAVRQFQAPDRERVL
jgi:hypothetical protein